MRALVCGRMAVELPGRDMRSGSLALLSVPRFFLSFQADDSPTRHSSLVDVARGDWS